MRRPFEAFFELSTCRNDSNPIPWTAIKEYAQAYGFLKDEVEFRAFNRMIRGMDQVYLDHVHSKHKKLREAQEKQARKPTVKARR